MKRTHIAFVSGFTLAEMIVALGVSSAMFLSLIMAFMSLQSSFSGINSFSQQLADQQRVIDYITRDIRRATSATLPSGSQTLALTVPDQYVSSGTNTYAYDAQGNAIGTLATPDLTGTSSSYYGTTANTLAVTYYLSGQNIIRQQITPATSGTSYLIVASGVSDFQLNFIALTTVINFTVSFSPQFSARHNWAASSVSTTISSSAALRDNLAY